MANEPTLIPDGAPTPAFADGYSVQKVGNMVTIYFMRLPVTFSEKQRAAIRALGPADEFHAPAVGAVTVEPQFALELANTLQSLVSGAKL